MISSPKMLIPLHGIASRHDLPLPFSFVVVGAGVALVVSFVILVLAWRRPRFSTLGSISLDGFARFLDQPAVRVVARVLIIATYAWAALALALGPDLLTNPVFGFVYVWMWVGLVPTSLLFGQWWRATNPLRTLHAALSAVAGVDPGQGLVRLSRRVGIWPAAAGLFGFAWLELVQPDRTTLSVLRVWALAWLVIMVLGAIVFGRRWIGAADPFEAYASMVAQLSPLRRVGDQLRLVNPLAGLTHWRAPPGATAMVAVLLGSTAYDSFANTSWWIRTVQASTVSPVLWSTGGLLGMIAIVLLSFTAAARAMGRSVVDVGVDRPAAAYPRLLAGSLVPIVIGYAIAHYATLLIVEGQRTAIRWSDPLGRGWNVFGSAEMGVNASLFDHPTLIALIQLSAILIGHIVGIVCAHEKAVAVLPASHAVRGQWPMLVVMVGYTCAGLVLLFSP